MKNTFQLGQSITEISSNKKKIEFLIDLLHKEGVISHESALFLTEVLPSQYKLTLDDLKILQKIKGEIAQGL